MGVDPDSGLVLCSVSLQQAFKVRERKREREREREPGDLADFQTFPLPKATFLRVLCKRAGL